MCVVSRLKSLTDLQIARLKCVIFLAGSLLFNPINAWLVTRFGWRAAFRVSSAMIAAFGIPCCWTFSSKQEIGHSQFEEEPEDIAPVAVEEAPPIPRRCCTLSELKQRPQILMWYLANLLSYLGFFMPFLNLVSTR